LQVESVSIHPGGAQLDLFYTWWMSKGSINGRFEYNKDIFEHQSIQRIADNFQIFVKAAIENANLPISAIPMLSEPERKLILEQWNSTKRDYPLEKLLHELFEDQVIKTPQNIAVVLENYQITFQDLNRRSNQLAHKLRKLGVGPDIPVAICLERSIEMIVSLLGVLKAGGAYVPFEPTYPEERLSFMFDDTKPPVFITHKNLAPVLQTKTYGHTLYVDNWEQFEGESSDNPLNCTSSKNLAYIIYTSGSTGQPKGVMIPHSGICNRLYWMQEEYKIKQSDHILQKTPFSFDVSLWELFLPLITGSKMILAAPGGHKDNAYLLNLITKESVSILHFVPSMLQAFLEEPNLNAISSIRHLFCSGETLPLHLEKLFYTKMNSRLHNLYGPTEASVDVTNWECSQDNKRPSVPIGCPISNTQIYILNNSLAPVPIGVTGELYITGKGLSLGYCNNPSLSEQMFIPNPFSDIPGDRLYKTGDMARWFSDGNIEYRGRRDSQIQFHGHRIELGEIESILSRFHDLSSCAVILDKTTALEGRIVAYYTTVDTNPIATETLRGFLKTMLPDHMIPSFYIHLPDMPITTSGKVDRKSLPKFKMEHKDALPRREHPTSKTEQIIESAWSSALDLTNFGLNDNFFEVGGNSILLTQVHLFLRDHFGSQLSIVNLFQFPTIASLATYIEQENKSSDYSHSIENRVQKQKQVFDRHKKRKANQSTIKKTKK